MFRGRYQLGEELPLLIQCVDDVGSPVAPNAAPVAHIWSETALVKSLSIPAMDQQTVTGLFGMRLFLGGAFAAGIHQVLYKYTAGSFTNVITQMFQILPGGDPDGAVVSMYGFRLPFATFLVHQLDSGKVQKGKNPRV